MVSTSDFKTGLTFQHDGNLYQIIEFLHVKPGKGSAFVRSKLRNLRSGAVIDRTWNAGDKFQEAYINRITMQYLYNTGEAFVFMNNETYEQIEIPVERMEREQNFILEGDEVTISQFEGEFLGVQIAEKVSLEVTVSEPAVKGNTANNATKLVTVETGYQLHVPMFVDQGDRIIINTNTGEYVSRDNK